MAITMRAYAGLSSLLDYYWGQQQKKKHKGLEPDRRKIITKQAEV
jgi:hypothetical protein